MNMFEMFLACAVLASLSHHIHHLVSSEKDAWASRRWLSIHEDSSFEHRTFSTKKLCTQSNIQCWSQVLNNLKQIMQTHFLGCIWQTK